MSTTFSNALSGLSSNARAIDVVSGNLANLNTTGYKSQSVSFQDLVSESLGGATSGGGVGGNTVTQTSRQFSQGSVQTTNQPFDAAIQGSGFFVLRTGGGQQVYSRAGNFKIDAHGHLLSSGGQFVQGWNAANGTLNTSGGVRDINLPISDLRQPSATTSFSLNVNLNASAVVGANSGTFTSPIQVVDSQGSTHVLTVTYTESSANNWDYTVTIPSADLAAGAGTDTTLSHGSLVFDGSGHLKTPDSKADPINVAITGLADGATDMAMNWNLYNTNGVASITAYSQASANLSSTQNGVPSSQLTGLSIGTDGAVLAHYSNGDLVSVAQLALASVLNPDSMQELGNNTYGITSATSLPAVGVPGTGSRGQIVGGSLESSTVDIAREFTNLLTYERGYQANSKVITTEDDILQETVGLKR